MLINGIEFSNSAEGIKQAARNLNKLNYPPSPKEYQKEYRLNNKEKQKGYYLNNKEKQKEYQKKYRKTSKYKIRNAKRHNYRRNNFGFNPINDWFEGSNGHHIDHINVIFIPIELHRQYYGHMVDKPETMVEINRVAFEYLTNDIKQI